jgi:type IX secretion system PorP/SprF family membrane protein
MKNLIILIFLMLASCIFLNAQDIHFSYFQLQPVHLNPALTGHFEGTIRVGGIYRDQGRVISTTGRYSTPSFYLDSPVIRGFGKYDWVGAGVSFTADGAGSSRLRNTISSLSLSYHLAFDKNRKNILSFGAQMAGVSRKFNKDSFRFYDEFGPNGEVEFSQTGENTEDFAFGDPIGMPTSYTSWSGGLVFTSKPNKENSFQLGVNLAHLNKPDQSITAASTDTLSRRLTAFATFTAQTSKRVSFTPTIMYQKMSVNSELVAQLMGNYLFNVEKDITLKGGLGFRLSGQPIIYLGFKKGDLNVGLSYDIDMSSLRQADSTVGGFELGASYIIKLYKQPKPDPTIFCPRL